MVDSRSALAQDGRRAERLELRVPNTATQLPEFQAVLKESGSDYVGDTPENFAKFIQAELAKWKKVAADSGATLD